MKIGIISSQLGNLTQFRGGAEVQIENTLYELNKYENIEAVFLKDIDDLRCVDIVHFFSSLPEFYVLSKKLAELKIPYVVSSIYYPPYNIKIVEIVHKISRFVPNFLKRLWYFSAVNELWKNAAFIFPNTDKEAELIYKITHSDNIHIILNGIKYDSDLNSITSEIFCGKYPKLKNEKFVLNVGRVEPRKNQHMLIRACNKLNQKLVVIGEISNISYYEICKNEDKKGLTTFLGRIDDRKLLHSAYEACKIFALPSKIETPGLSAIEAAIHKKPIIITKGGGTKYYFGDQVYYISSKNVKEIESALLKARTQSFVDYKDLEFLSWANIVREYIPYYREIMLKIEGQM